MIIGTSSFSDQPAPIRWLEAHFDLTLRSVRRSALSHGYAHARDLKTEYVKRFTPIRYAGGESVFFSIKDDLTGCHHEEEE